MELGRQGADRQQMHEVIREHGLEVARAVRAAWPSDKPLFYRISAVDGQGGMWNVEDSIAFSRAL